MTGMSPDEKCFLSRFFLTHETRFLQALLCEQLQGKGRSGAAHGRQRIFAWKSGNCLFASKKTKKPLWTIGGGTCFTACRRYAMSSRRTRPKPVFDLITNLPMKSTRGGPSPSTTQLVGLGMRLLEEIGCPQFCRRARRRSRRIQGRAPGDASAESTLAKLA